MAELTLIIPNLLAAAKQQPLPDLAQLLGKADVTHYDYTSLEQMLLALFNFPAMPCIPIAALTALADGLAVATDEWWLRVDPVELQADHATVYLIGSEHLALSQDESAALVHDLNIFLKPDNLTILAPQPQRWYLKLDAEPQLITIPPDNLQGKPIKEYLSTGDAYWRRLFSEIQMLLHHHPINQRRVNAGKPAVNGLWFWGEGFLPAVLSSVNWDKIWSNSLLGRGLAQWQATPVTILPETLCLQQLEHAGRYLMVMDEVAANGLKQLLEYWFKPLKNAINNQQLTQLTLYLDPQHAFTLNPKNLQKWWRRHYRF